MLFSISQKLIQHQIVNYTEILKWLRDILVCRNAFLLRHKDYANCNIGAHIAICKQAHIKLEVGCFVFFFFYVFLFSLSLFSIQLCSEIYCLSWMYIFRIKSIFFMNLLYISGCVPNVPVEHRHGCCASCYVML